MNANYRGKKGLFILLLLSFFLGLGAIVKLLWNGILPEVTGVHEISYWQALGLLVLCKILFFNFRFGNHRRSPFYKNGWSEMNESRKEKIKEEWKKRFE